MAIPLFFLMSAMVLMAPHLSEHNAKVIALVCIVVAIVSNFIMAYIDK